MKFKDKNERRSFLKKISAGSLGIGAAISGLAATDPVFARLNQKFAGDHVSQVIDKIKAAEPNSGAELAFTQTMDNLIQLVDFKKDETAIRVMNMAEKFLKKINLENYGLDSDGLLKLPTTLSDSLVGAYLASIDKFNFGEFGENELRRSLDLVDTMEPDFLPLFAERIQDEMSVDSDMAEKFSTFGQPALQSILSANKNLSSQNKLIDPVTLTWVVIIVVVVVVVIFAVLFGEKR